MSKVYLAEMGRLGSRVLPECRVYLAWLEHGGLPVLPVSLGSWVRKDQKVLVAGRALSDRSDRKVNGVCKVLRETVVLKEQLARWG